MTNKRNLLTGQTSLSGLGRWENGSRHAWYKTNLERSGPDFPFVVGKILMYDKNLLRCCQTGSRNFATLEFYFLAPTGAQGVKMCVRASVCASVRLCDIMLTSTLEEFLRVLKSLK